MVEKEERGDNSIDNNSSNSLLHDTYPSTVHIIDHICGKHNFFLSMSICLFIIFRVLFIFITLKNLISSQIVTTRVPLKIPNLEITNLVINFASMSQKIVDEHVRFSFHSILFSFIFSFFKISMKFLLWAITFLYTERQLLDSSNNG